MAHGLYVVRRQYTGDGFATTAGGGLPTQRYRGEADAMQVFVAGSAISDPRHA
jgi:hypothetical protein